MRIVSWNILQGGGSRSQQIIEQLKAWSPDIVGLCEFRGGKASKSIADALQEMGLVNQHATTNPDRAIDDRLMIASRFPIQVQKSPGVLGSTGRWIHAKVDARRTFDLVLMWVPNRREACTQPVFHRHVLDALAPYSGKPVLAMGDTNTGVPGVDEDSNYFKEAEGQ
ncbi:MAG: endonuclease/exonuclease/phosphatase family protein [Pirellulales bacterium]